MTITARVTVGGSFSRTIGGRHSPCPPAVIPRIACTATGASMTRASTNGTTGTRCHRMRTHTTAAPTVFFHSSPFATPARAATGTAHHPGARHTSAPAAVRSTKFSDVQPTSSTGGSPCHHLRITPARCINGETTSIGTTAASRYQDSEIPEATTESVAHG